MATGFDRPLPRRAAARIMADASRARWLLVPICHGRSDLRHVCLRRSYPLRQGRRYSRCLDTIESGVRMQLQHGAFLLLCLAGAAASGGAGHRRTCSRSPCRIRQRPGKRWPSRPMAKVAVTEAQGNRISRIDTDGRGLPGLPAAPYQQRAAHHRAGRRRQHVVLRTQAATASGASPLRASITELRHPHAGNASRAIALGADGNIWFGEFASGRAASTHRRA